MDLQIIKISKAKKDVLSHLMQFYFYDFSEYKGPDVLESGLYGSYSYFDDYWMDEAHRFPFFIMTDGKYAGFALVRYIEPANQFPYYSIAEFFIMKKYRRQGLGRVAATTLFDGHRGCHWEVSQDEKNVPSQLFWNRVIHEYTGGSFTDRQENGRRIQEFLN
ncbi:GNAT family N-acetyltransferase [Sporolactobacillus shoreae]|uniref:GNAT family N-acetyltransferase n=1 Tax=Sporolactobacillus shoreae TaxID=1465501 RepID=A0A4Z0GP43_9BACL|nr:GNAT family N-acetyltransferase [Sporolactobacillus shoreae]TGA97674.1 GNAT family N-acetyltransferase [Sporolactobacillus shoreae]